MQLLYYITPYGWDILLVLFADLTTAWLYAFDYTVLNAHKVKQ